MQRGSLMRLFWVVGLLAAVGCSDPVEEAGNVAEACGDRPCPVGTAFTEIRSIKAGIDITAGVDPATYSGEAAYSRFGEGQCEYACQAINLCPDGTFPVITASCFTCATLNAQGELVQPDC